MTDSDVSIIVPTKNEESIVSKNLEKIYEYAKKCNLIDRFEILVCDFSNDSTPEKVKTISKKLKEVRYVLVKKSGIGAGLKAGFSEARFDVMIFYPIDMSWDMTVIENSLTCLRDGWDVILGSRGASGSEVKRALNRRFFSFFYNAMLHLFFGIEIKDTQGTIAIRKRDFVAYRGDLMFDDPFLQTELLIHSKIMGLRIKEIPVTVIDTRKESKINPIKIGISMMSSVIRKYFYMK